MQTPLTVIVVASISEMNTLNFALCNIARAVQVTDVALYFYVDGLEIYVVMPHKQCNTVYVLVHVPSITVCSITALGFFHSDLRRRTCYSIKKMPIHPTVTRIFPVTCASGIVPVM